MKYEHNVDWVAITYPQDFSNQGQNLGPQSILRLKKIVEVKKGSTYKIAHVVLACGIGPDNERPTLQTRPFYEMMKEWLLLEGTFSEDQIHCSDNRAVWNCIEVTTEIIWMVRGLNLPKNILVVSTGGHIYPRMWITWKLITLFTRWKVRFAPDWTGSYSKFHEWAGTVKYIPIALWYRFVLGIM